VRMRNMRARQKANYVYVQQKFSQIEPQQHTIDNTQNKRQYTQ